MEKKKTSKRIRWVGVAVDGHEPDQWSVEQVGQRVNALGQGLDIGGGRGCVIHSTTPSRA